MKKNIIFIIISVSVWLLFLTGFLFSVNYIVNYFGIPRYVKESLLKNCFSNEAECEINCYYEKNNCYPEDFCTKETIEEYKNNYLAKKFKLNNISDDFYYRYGSNWFELGYFLTYPRKKKAKISGVLYKSSTNYIYKTIKLDAIDFYKTNTIFKNGLFNKK